MSANEQERPSEQGFALVLAMLALMLMTFLGLTLATTTSTEMQIAANYRWGQQAYYNAEAGLEVARVALATAGSWSPFLPSPGIRPPSTPFAATRNFELAYCDTRGNGMGYGAVMAGAGLPFPLENVTTIYGHSLNGAFTVWVRRDLVPDPADPTGATLMDDPSQDVAWVTVEGTAPFVGGQYNMASTRSRRAVRTLQTKLTLGSPCTTDRNQSGGDAKGSGARKCDPFA